MTTPISKALALIAAIEAGKPLDPEEVKAALWRLINELEEAMNIPGYDEWKLRSPEEDYERRGGKICPFCGAYSPRQRELEEETSGNCPWEMSEPHPDDLRDQREEDRHWHRDYDDGDF